MTAICRLARYGMYICAVCVRVRARACVCACLRASVCSAGVFAYAYEYMPYLELSDDMLNSFSLLQLLEAVHTFQVSLFQVAA